MAHPGEESSERPLTTSRLPMAWDQIKDINRIVHLAQSTTSERAVSKMLASLANRRRPGLDDDPNWNDDDVLLELAVDKVAAHLAKLSGIIPTATAESGVYSDEYTKRISTRFAEIVSGAELWTGNNQ